jgi:hypothetical protein
LTVGGKVCKLPAGPTRWGSLCFPLSTPKRGPAVSIVFLSEYLGHDAVSKLIKR